MYSYKIYNFSKSKSINDNYFEIPYVEMREDGEVVCTGTEDFSKKRMQDIKMYSILIHNENDFYGHGLKKWREKLLVRVMRRKDALLYGKKMFPENEVQVKKII